jgi:NAD(P)H dehydrogenase (quinone)
MQLMFLSIMKILPATTSLYGHITAMSAAVKKGIEASGATCDIYQVSETLNDEVLSKMGAPPKPDFPVITPDKMLEYDGFMFGLSGRFGTFPAQMKTFFDSCGGLWQKGSLTGKAAGTFTSVGTMGGGQETVNLSCVPFFTHQGMIFVPLGYVEPKVFTFEEIHGASAYGCGTFAGVDGSRQPTDLEKEIAETHGKHFASIAAKLV